MRRGTLLGLLASTVGLLAFGPASAFAATIPVDDDSQASPTNCNAAPAASATVQGGVDAANPGDTVRVCPGTYEEQVTITDNRITLVSAEPQDAVIKAPPTVALTEPKAIVRVNGGRNVSILRFEITGPGPGPCDSIRYGVRVDGDGTATIQGNLITLIQDNPFSGCQNGVGIQVGRQAENETGEALIVNNRIIRYQKNGITVDGADSHGVIRANRIDGAGPTPVIAQNGVQISRGATGAIRDSHISDNTYSLAPASGSTGVLLFEVAGGVIVANNRLERNDDNVSAITTSDTRIQDNRLLDSTFFDGISMADDTSENHIEDNVAENNAEHDCHDDSSGSGTANTANQWIDNQGQTETPPGICED